MMEWMVASLRRVQPGSALFVLAALLTGFCGNPAAGIAAEETPRAVPAARGGSTGSALSGTAAATAAAGPAELAPASDASTALEDSAFLDLLQRSAVNFFWIEANSSNGLIKDRSTPNSASSIASVGYGLTAICIGIDRGWIPADQGRQRVLTTLKTFWGKPQGREARGYIGYKGFFYHFLYMSTALRDGYTELSDIDTALLLAGVVYSREFFAGEDPAETEIRALADSIYCRVDWQWMRNYQPGLTTQWTPEKGFGGGWWSGYNEMMIMYILGLGSPTHPLPASAWKAWCGGYSWQTLYGQEYVIFPPLFGHQFSHCWIDFRGIQDEYMAKKGIDYFENSRRATLAQQAYCIANPKGWKGYGEKVWGITACDGPTGYAARGAPPAENDDGTIAPTAVGGSLPFAPEICLPTLRHFYDAYRTQLWGAYGFRDAFNLQRSWWGTDVIGIDQGPVALMIENYRSGKVWKTFMKNADVRRGLERAGFKAVDTKVGSNPSERPRSLLLKQNYPNPFNSATVLEYELLRAGRITLTLHDVTGRSVRSLYTGVQSAGPHRFSLAAGNLASGIYFCRLACEGETFIRKLEVLR